MPGQSNINEYHRRAPKPRIRSTPLLPASEIGVILPADVPIDFFTPEFYNALPLKERARYVNIGVAFPLAEFAFNKKHEDWKTMGKKRFMFIHGNDVLEEYDIPKAQEINGIPDSDVDNDEEVEINLENTDDDEDEEMDVDAELNSED
ncbi:hypothetical protein B0H17DRAFT_1268968 [Mycena rosella]|uniref:Uncharacterized protein n=1 Tax=Mycena rosella TaxID=1033263 RepID=A0AAD7G3K9_MYCRO|nr:hypothetical protein B0H17DRAFT_1268968 [Mycena rosella]